MMKYLSVFLFALLLAVAPALAVEPGEVLSDPTLEKRARDISQNLRCLVCQNQSIDDSNADLAKDLRVLVRDRLVKGDADDEVIRYVVSRYGDYVLLKPPLKLVTLGLWAGPLLILILGILAVVAFMRRHRTPRLLREGSDGQNTPVATPLSDAEKKRLKTLLDGDGA